MDSEERELLKETLELAKENNKMLHKVRGVQKRQFIWGTLKVLLVLAIAFGSFYYLEPYLNKLMDIYSQISGKSVNVDPATLQQMLKNVR